MPTPLQVRAVLLRALAHLSPPTRELIHQALIDHDAALASGALITAAALASHQHALASAHTALVALVGEWGLSQPRT